LACQRTGVGLNSPTPHLFKYVNCSNFRILSEVQEEDSDVIRVKWDGTFIQPPSWVKAGKVTYTVKDYLNLNEQQG